MNTEIRSTVSGTIFAGLLGVFIHAVASNGLTSDSALLGFSLLAIQGLVEVAVVSRLAAVRLAVGAAFEPLPFDAAARAAREMAGCEEALAA